MVVIKLGYSNFASVLFRGWDNEPKVLHTAYDGTYTAIVINKDLEPGQSRLIEIKPHIYETKKWVKIYDDFKCMATVYASDIKVYDSGDYTTNFIIVCSGLMEIINK